MNRTVQRPVDYSRRVELDTVTGNSTVTVTKDGGAWHAPDVDLACDAFAVERASITADDPLSARYEVTATHRLARGDWRVSAETRSVLTATSGAFQVQLDLDAYEGDTRFFSKSWTLSVPRDHL